MTVEKIKAGQAIVQFQGQELEVGKTYELQDDDFNTIGQFSVRKIAKQKAVIKINGGDFFVGTKGTVTPVAKPMSTKNRMNSHESRNSRPTQSTWSGWGNLFVGSGEGGSSSTEGASSSSTSATGFGLGLSYEMWLSSLSLGADFSYSSYSMKGGSATGTDLGLIAGLLLPDLKIKIFGGLYVFGTGSVSGATASGMSGFKVGANYFLTNSISVLGQYKSVEYSSVSVSELSTSAASIGFKGFVVGAMYHF